MTLPTLCAVTACRRPLPPAIHGRGVCRQCEPDDTAWDRDRANERRLTEARELIAALMWWVPRDTELEARARTWLIQTGENQNELASAEPTV